jgi:16S rRNA (adenine1518-N6/adenine1519-N6)-dimethyltransferase
LNDYSSPKRLLAARGLRPRKRLGQNFLVDANVARRIADALPADAYVLEIGGGTGVLTSALADVARSLDVVEIDRGLAAILRERFADAPPYVRVLEADALDIDLRISLAAHEQPRAVCGNLPYSITTPLLERIVAVADLWECAVLMVQREYARRLTARPGTPDYGSLTVFVSYFCEAAPLFDVGAAGFYPAPAVASSVVKLVPKPDRARGVADEALCLWLIRAAFAQRRKTLVNSVAATAALGARVPQANARALHDVIEAGVRATGLPEGIRGERLALPDFIKLTNALAAQGFRAPAR